jgi:subtilisin-like proprotein convertase family protein
MAEDADFTTGVLTATVSGTEFVVPAALEALTTYFWRVRAENACGIGEYSAVRSFTTELKVCAASPLVVPDAMSQGVTSEVALTNTAVINDLDVWLDVTHTWVGDLKFVLEHVDTGTQVTLIDRPGVPATTYGCHSDNIETTLDDNAAELAENSCNTPAPALIGTLRPAESLAAFKGELWSGTWRLSVTDAASPDTGTLNNWCLLPSYSANFDQQLFLPLVMD